MAEMTCTECGCSISDETGACDGSPWHITNKYCIAALREQLAFARGNRVSERKPNPHTRYVVLRDGKLFTATPCYGCHDPWWVVKTMASSWPDEADPEPMQPDDMWWPLGEYLLRLAC